ncbi:acyl-CoA synthetase (AMP-forming)/AMP-acid ligase II [Tamaricihabitans halophyticus]|uniref:Acyl-CoA synthetase (AMP-forming)/AMP-acid ligase II n=1 Tax=Tamaricihabitans halophyticus TaxID=1262583 RepID=A0A4V2SU84_9PSEU|nr:AMP-binding protein [Tamaricihabitans halophyticus]TCP53546.1 acyl-CoA synthetase (AMP-forming)/AMP-acid ligase II [Tamaricihabitans halophyticus]
MSPMPATPTATLRPELRAVNLAELLSQTARRLPDAEAIVSGRVRITWRELDERVDAAAGALRAQGIGHGDPVLVHSPNQIELIQAMFAIWRVGAVFAPTNYRLAPPETAELAELIRPAAVICHVDYPAHADAAGTAGQPRAGIWWTGAGSDARSGLWTLPPAEAQPNEPVRTGDHAWYFFTSGTSGRSKAAVLTHDQMGFVVTNHLCDLLPALSELDAQVVVAPLSHGAGIHLLPQVARGAKTVLPEAASLDPAEIWRLVQTERVTNMFTVPTILKRLAEAPETTEYDLSSLRYVIYAGAPMYRADQERARAALGDVLVQYYGLGEVTGNITVLPPSEHGRHVPAGIEFGTCGRPRTGIQISVQQEDGVECGPGVQGEICVAGPAVFAGYLNNQAANEGAFRDGWFRTGDLGLVDDGGYLYVTGRASDMFISGGSNIYPREIEEKLLRHPAISEVAVVGMPDARWGEVGVAVLVTDSGQELDEAELRAWLHERVARYKVPKRFVRWESIPKSGYGKIVKRTIRDALLRENGAGDARSASG